MGGGWGAHEKAKRYKLKRATNRDTRTRNDGEYSNQNQNPNTQLSNMVNPGMMLKLSTGMTGELLCIHEHK